MENKMKPLQDDESKSQLSGVSESQNTLSDSISRVRAIHLKSFSDSIKLHEADYPWKPSFKLEIPASEAILVEDKLKRNVRSILNKLTTQKFEILVEQWNSLNIHTEADLWIVINLIHEKAIAEPMYSGLYANMCTKSAQIKVPTENEEFVHFHQLILAKCQKEFKQGFSYQIKDAEKLKVVEDTSDKKKRLEQETYEAEKKVRYRQLGNIRFVGELFKFNMVVEPIIHNCITLFLNQGDEGSLEGLCVLMKTTWKKLGEVNTVNSRKCMELYFTQIQTIIDKHLISKRIKFMLQDLIDMTKELSILSSLS